MIQAIMMVKTILILRQLNFFSGAKQITNANLNEKLKRGTTNSSEGFDSKSFPKNQLIIVNMCSCCFDIK